MSRAIGGSLSGERPGEQRFDLVASRRFGALSLGLSLAASRGRLWRYSETRGGYGGALQMSVASHLDLALGAGRYATTFGALSHEWYRAAAATVHIADFRFSVKFVGTELGLGSGTGLALGYEPRLR